MEKFYIVKWELDAVEENDSFSGISLMNEKLYQGFKAKLDKAKDIISKYYPKESECEKDEDLYEDLYTTCCGSHQLSVSDVSFDENNLIIKEISPLTYDEISSITGLDIGYVNIEAVLDEIITEEKYLK